MRQARVAKLISRSYRSRKAFHLVFCAALLVATLTVIAPLLGIFWYALSKGIPALTLHFFTALPKPVGEAGGGMGNALLGTFTLVTMASALGVPWGIAAGTWLSEYGRGTRMAVLVRFTADQLASLPSIVLGLFVYSAVVAPMRRFSALAGALALALLMVPTVCRTTEETLKLVPVHIREAGLALGLPRWKMILWIVLKGARSSLVTGVMLALARAGGETAPLLFTAMNNRFWQSGLDQPIASLPVQIYTYAISPFEDWHRQAWAAACVLVTLVFTINLAARAMLGSVKGGA
jgi:phosphate transport system permease protein